jgi:hypothetical protein
MGAMWAEGVSAKHKNLEKDNAKGSTSRICRNATWMKFDKSRDLDDVIKWEIFSFDRLKDFRSARGRKPAFPILNAYCS